MIIRRFRPEDAAEVSALVVKTLREVNIRDYSEEAIEEVVRRSRPEDMLSRGRQTHFYVACDGGAIVGCGAIGPYWDRADESCFFTIFVRPDRQGRGIGRKIVETLERDEYFLRSRRIEIPASVTAAPFYLKMGYTFKNGVTEPDEEELIRLEKRR
ncbi:MAG: GNAT family N-acetyltransferase [Oscillospiraceae bacterium]|nr:GNAT family N-acetyltransferase [Oscillospiraceae bacterium]